MEVVFITLSHMWHLPQSSPGRKVARRGGSAVETRESTARRGGAGRVGVAEPGLSLYHWQAEGWGGSKPPEPAAGGGGVAAVEGLWRRPAREWAGWGRGGVGRQ